MVFIIPEWPQPVKITNPLFSNLQTSLINYHDISELQKSKNIILEIEKTINELFYKYIQFIHLFMS